MKRLFLTLVVAVFLLGETMTAHAYNYTVNGMQCYCSISNQRSVMAYTACSNTTVTIRSTAYNSAGGSIITNGDARSGYASVNYTTNQDISYTIQVHEAPSLGESITLVEFA